jgi:hypothetical protein
LLFEVYPRLSAQFGNQGEKLNGIWALHQASPFRRLMARVNAQNDPVPKLHDRLNNLKFYCKN